MKRLSVAGVNFLLLAAACLAFVATAHAAWPVSVGAGFEVASGDYGSGSKVQSVYLPVTLAVQATSRAGFLVEIPYLYQSRSSVNTTVFTGPGGRMAAVRKDAVPMAGSPGGAAGGGGGGGLAAGERSALSTSPETKASESQHGLGDILAKVGYVLVEEGGALPRVRPYLTVKFPTADRERALGTGEFDAGLAVELSRELDGWYGFADAGYTFQGRSPLLPLKDFASYSAGIGHIVADRYLPMLVVKGAGAPVDGAGDLLEVRARLKCLVTGQTWVDGYLARGVTRGSPDYGAGLMVFYNF